MPLEEAGLDIIATMENFGGFSESDFTIVNVYIRYPTICNEDQGDFVMSWKIALCTILIIFCWMSFFTVAADDCGCDGGGSDGGGSDGGSDSGSSSDSSDSGSDTFGGDAVIWRMKGDDFFKKGLYNESLEAYEKAVSIDPYNLKTWTGIGLVYLELGESAKAVTAYQKAIKLDPGDPNLHVLLGDAYTANGTYADAISSYQKGLAMKTSITGVREKIAIAETAQAGGNMIQNMTPDITATPETNEPAVLQTAVSSVAVNETVQSAVSTKAALPGLIAGIAVVITGLFILVKRK
jgi:tetratricopeptide (TPR) repeat protein